MNWKFYELFVTVLCVSRIGEGARILLMSHQTGGEAEDILAIGEHLSQQGHDVYIVSCHHEQQYTNNRYSHIKRITFAPLDGARCLNSGWVAKDSVERATNGQYTLLDLSVWAAWECESLMHNTTLTEIVRNLHFDLALVDYFSPSPCLYLLPYVHGIAYITIGAYIEEWICRSPLLPSFAPIQYFSISNHMTFAQRMLNFFSSVILRSSMWNPFAGYRNVTLLTKYIENATTKHWIDLVGRSELFFVTKGAVLDWPQPYFPNVITLEALTVAQPQSLPPDILRIVRNATHGVVFVKLGPSLMFLPASAMETLLRVFSKRRETFICHHDDSDATIHLDNFSLIKLPANVYLYSIQSLNDLLGDKKARLYITDGHSHNIYPALYHGVPILSLPLQADQVNTASMVSIKGYGLDLSPEQINYVAVSHKLSAILDNASFQKRAQTASRILHKMAAHSCETASYWVNYVLEVGAEHLRSGAADMPLYQYYLLDVVAFLMFISTVLLYLISRCTATVWDILTYATKCNDLKCSQCQTKIT